MVDLAGMDEQPRYFVLDSQRRSPVPGEPTLAMSQGWMGQVDGDENLGSVKHQKDDVPLLRLATRVEYASRMKMRVSKYNLLDSWRLGPKESKRSKSRNIIY